ncbi:serine protein kinase RIO [Candidatus Bathyarchaeota archaeon]|nr:serine protein kinase RIO [Candidatus Bathyarchaeota archaeon]
MNPKNGDEVIEEKLRKKEYLLDVSRRKRIKKSEDYDVFDEVFNKSTLMTVYSMLNKGFIKDFDGTIAAGKESKIFYARGPHNEELAVKIYLVTNREFRKSMIRYINGDPRFSDIPKKSQELINLWAKKEFNNLQSLKEAGLRVPIPHRLEENVLVMEFIGRNGVRANLLKETNLDFKEYENFYQKTLDFMVKAVKRANLVHGDLGEYNIMVFNDELVFFDVSQAVSIEHPMAGQLFKRDFENINRFFSRKGVKTIELKDFIESIGGLDTDVRQWLLF